jgi:hypothetical protein
MKRCASFSPPPQTNSKTLIVDSENNPGVVKFLRDRSGHDRRRHFVMPEKETIERAREDEREGKAPSTQAGEFVREEIEHIREGKHGARSTKQAIAIGLSKARRAGVKLQPPKKGTTSKQTRRQAKRDLKKGTKRAPKKTSKTRARAAKKALKKEGRKAASKKALSRQAKSAARKRTKADRSAAAKKAARTRARK